MRVVKEVRKVYAERRAIRRGGWVSSKESNVRKEEEPRVDRLQKDSVVIYSRKNRYDAMLTAVSSGWAVGLFFRRSGS